MACRGVHFAITDEDLAQLRRAKPDADVMQIVETIEERWEQKEGYLCETDKAWDAIHRCLTEGELSFQGGTDPLRLCVLGGEQLYEGDDYIVALVTYDQLRPLADALAAVTPEFIGTQYWALPANYPQPKSHEDCQYTWDWFSDLPAFFDRAHQAGRHVLFTVDQ